MSVRAPHGRVAVRSGIGHTQVKLQSDLVPVNVIIIKLGAVRAQLYRNLTLLGCKHGLTVE